MRTKTRNFLLGGAAAFLFMTAASGLSNPPAPSHGDKPAPAPAKAANPPAASAPSGKPGAKPATKEKAPAVIDTPKAKPADAHDDQDGHDAEPASAPSTKTTGGETPPSPSPATTAPATPPTADEALKLLQEGNARWVADSCQAPSTDASRRRTQAENGQTPWVTILTCADSRIPVERVFDRGVGELFVVRVAGNVVQTSEAGTIEYGAGHLKTPLLVVMGHTKCGAVKAVATGAQVGGNIAPLVAPIRPAVDRARNANKDAAGDELVAQAVRENVWQSIFDLVKSSTECREMVRDGKLKIVGAVYDVSSGKVEWLGEHPWQAALVEAMAGKPAEQTASAHADEPAGH